MKLLVSLFLIALIASGVYSYSYKVTNRNKKQKHKKTNGKAIGITAVVAMLLLAFVAFQMYRAATAPDTQCTTVHAASSIPQANLKSAMDYFLQGNYDYDTGDCKKAIVDYTSSIQMNPNSPQAYNNRAYAYMRMQNYKAALPDLEKALQLNPNYIQALMNRGDIYNYYYAVDGQRAIADYERVISLGGIHGTSVCGHLFLAKHNGWNLGTIMDFPRVILRACN